MKPDVTDVDSRSYGHGEGLNPAIEVLVIERILIVPDSSRRAGYFVAHEPDPVVSRVGLHLIYCGTGPSHNSRLHSHCGEQGGKCESGSAAHAVLTIGSIVIHVALSGM